jgi:hypothetical protein
LPHDLNNIASWFESVKNITNFSLLVLTSLSKVWIVVPTRIGSYYLAFLLKASTS